jgi:hypothetical protein
VDVNDPAQAANFASGGFTHADFSASSEFVVGAVSIAPVGPPGSTCRVASTTRQRSRIGRARLDGGRQHPVA